MLKRTALALSLAVVFHVVSPAAHALRPGPTLLEKTKRATALRTLLDDFRKHRQLVQIRTTDGQVISGYLREVSDRYVILSNGQEATCDTIEKVHANRLTRRQVGMLIGVGILVTAVVVATQTK